MGNIGALHAQREKKEREIKELSKDTLNTLQKVHRATNSQLTEARRINVTTQTFNYAFELIHITTITQATNKISATKLAGCITWYDSFTVNNFM